MNYVHHIPGRLRVRSAVIRGSEHKANEAKAILQAIEGVTSVEARPLTGSVTLLYDPAATNGEMLLARLREHGYTSHLRVPARSAPPVLHDREIRSMVARRVAKIVVEKALERSVVALVTALL